MSKFERLLWWALMFSGVVVFIGGIATTARAQDTEQEVKQIDRVCLGRMNLINTWTGWHEDNVTLGEALKRSHVEGLTRVQMDEIMPVFEYIWEHTLEENMQYAADKMRECYAQQRQSSAGSFVYVQDVVEPQADFCSLLTADAARVVVWRSRGKTKAEVTGAIPEGLPAGQLSQLVSMIDSAFETDEDPIEFAVSISNKCRAAQKQAMLYLPRPTTVDDDAPPPSKNPKQDAEELACWIRGAQQAWGALARYNGAPKKAVLDDEATLKPIFDSSVATGLAPSDGIHVLNNLTAQDSARYIANAYFGWGTAGLMIEDGVKNPGYHVLVARFADFCKSQIKDKASKYLPAIELTQPPIDWEVADRVWEYVKKEMGAPADLTPPRIVLDWDVPPYARMGTQWPRKGDTHVLPLQISLAPRVLDTEGRSNPELILWALGHEFLHYALILKENGWDANRPYYSITRKHHCDPEFLAAEDGIADLLWNIWHRGDIRGRAHFEAQNACAKHPEQ